VRPVADALPAVMVDGLERWTCADCGEHLDVWPQAAPLMALVLRVVLAKGSRLSPAEFRWLRERLGWKSVELATRFGVTPEIVSKWERGRSRISSQGDRLLRALVALHRGVPADGVGLALTAGDEPVSAALTLGPKGWRIVQDHATAAGKTRG
jgi:DNA-binding transcriptional regulator YiaG